MFESETQIFTILVFIMSGGAAMITLNTIVSMLAFDKPQVPLEPAATDSPLVSLLVPARNEEKRLGACLDSLSKQTWPHLEILVLDDNSTDGTAALVASHAERDPRIKVLKGTPLPEGWVGKPWAVHQLSKKAKGDYFLFTDADTRHQPACVAATVAAMEKSRADLLSLWPYEEAITLGEQLIIPLMHLLILGLRPHWLERLIRIPALAAANGQFILFRAGAYRKAGGHEAVKNHLVEDIALSRHCVAKGLRVVNMDGTDLVTCRMYENFAEVWSGFTKNLRAAFDRQWIIFIFFGVTIFSFLIAPFLVWPLLFNYQLIPEALLCLAVVLMIYFLRLIMAARFLHPIGSVLLHPFGTTLALIIATNSWLQLYTRGVEWKGRRYKG